MRAELDKHARRLAGAMIDGKTGEDLNKLTADYAAAAAQMTKIEADAFAKIYAMLKPNQQAKAEQAFELMAGMFSRRARAAAADAAAGWAAAAWARGRGEAGRGLP